MIRFASGHTARPRLQSPHCPEARDEPDTVCAMTLPEGDTKMSPTPKMSLKSGRSEMFEQVTLRTQNARHCSP